MIYKYQKLRRNAKKKDTIYMKRKQKSYIYLDNK